MRRAPFTTTQWPTGPNLGKNQMRCFSILAISLLAAASPSQIAMSNYARTFTSTLTRGMYFQAPVDFKVTGVQVPDETSKGKQVVAIYRTSAAPPPSLS